MIKKDYPDDWTDLDKQFAKLMKESTDIESDFYEEFHDNSKTVDYDSIFDNKEKNLDNK